MLTVLIVVHCCCEQAIFSGRASMAFPFTLTTATASSKSATTVRSAVCTHWLFLLRVDVSVDCCVVGRCWPCVAGPVARCRRREESANRQERGAQVCTAALLFCCSLNQFVHSPSVAVCCRFRAFLKHTFPCVADAPAVYNRTCIYNDVRSAVSLLYCHQLMLVVFVLLQTFDSDFLIDHDPDRPGLLIATGGLPLFLLSLSFSMHFAVWSHIIHALLPRFRTRFQVCAVPR